jgi:hypothetical protein
VGRVEAARAGGAVAGGDLEAQARWFASHALSVGGRTGGHRV